MTDIEFDVPQSANLRGAAALIEKACQECGLRISTRFNPQKESGCIHWHVKRGILSGTLELTLCDTKRRIWASVKDNRRAPWMDEDLPRLKEAVEMALRMAIS